MFDTVEKHRGFFKILLALIALSFVTFTAHSFNSAGKDYIVKVDKFSVTNQDVDNILRQNNLNSTAENRQIAFKELVQNAFLLAGGEKLGLNISPEMAKLIIMNSPEFQENGQFIESKFQQWLANNRLSEADYITQLIKWNIPARTQSLVTMSPMVADSQIETLFNIYGAPRLIRTLSFNAEHYGSQVKTSDDAIAAFYQEQSKHYIQPRAVRFEYIKLATDDLINQQSLSNEELQAALNSEVNADQVAVEHQLKREKSLRQLLVLKDEISEAAFNDNTSLESAAKVANSTVQKHNSWLTENDSEIPTEVINALFSDDVLRARNNSETIQVGDTLWVVRVTDSREESQRALNEIYDEVKHDYVAAQSIILANQSAKESLDKLNKGQSVSGWGAKSTMNRAMIEQLLTSNDLSAYFSARPSQNNSAYVLVNQGSSNPTLIAIDSIEKITMSDDEKQSSFVELALKMMQMDVMDYMLHLQHTLKSQPGRQQLSNAE